MRSLLRGLSYPLLSSGAVNSIFFGTYSEMEFLKGIFGTGFLDINSSLLRPEFLSCFFYLLFSVEQNAFHE